MLSTAIVVAVVRRHRVQRSEARGRGVGRWHHHFGKYVDSPSTQKQEGCIVGFLHPETHFQKSEFSGTALSGSESAKTIQYMCVFAKERCHVDGALNSGSVTAVTCSVNLTCSLAGLPEETLSLTELSDSSCPFLLSPIMLREK